jgi:tetratricopeptide (TPR) repeat protein
VSGDAVARARCGFARQPRDPGRALMLALALRDAARLEEAAAMLDLAALLAPGREDVARPRRQVRAALAAAGDEPGAVMALARAWFAAGGLAEPLPMLAALLERADLSAALLGELAGLLVAAGAAVSGEAAARRRLAMGGAGPRDWVVLGLALHQQDRLAEALAAYEAALALAPGDVPAACDAGMVRLARGELGRGFALFERRHAAVLPDLAALRGARVVLEGEQGHGDTIQFARYAPMLAAAGARVTLRVQPGLVRLLGELAPAVASGAAADGVSLPLASMPALFGTELSTVPGAPYLTAALGAAAAWRGRLAGRSIGLVWAGEGRTHLADRAMDARRSIAPGLLAPLGAVPGLTFVSLQKAAREMPPLPLCDWTAELADFADTAALVAALDLVITVDTAVAHLAGALGRPVWLLNRFDADWRWLRGRDDCPWYPSLRQFRQARPGDWDGVVARVAEALSA